MDVILVSFQIGQVLLIVQSNLITFLKKNMFSSFYRVLCQTGDKVTDKII